MMGLGDAYQESTDTVLRVMAARPIEPEAPKPKHSAWTTLPRAVTAAAAEVGGNIMDVVGAYGQVSAAYGQNQLIPDTPEVRKQRVEVFDKLQNDGIDWRTDESKQAYFFARDLRPDPMTAWKGENIFFGLVKGLTKAIGAGVALGPAGGAAAFGTSEGMTTSEDLAAQGVDQETRMKVGAVTGALNAAGMALPVAGKTLAQTAALIAVGGPGSFIAQQQAIRSILENADYHALAQQYDPLDPTGLALATLLPAGFAAWAKGGAIKAAMAGKQKAPEVSGPAPTPEQIDAVMVHNLTAARDAHEATPAAKSEAEMWRGHVTENQNFKDWFGDSKAVDSEGKPLVLYHGTTADFQVFDKLLLGSSHGADSAKQGFFFTGDPAVASDYAGQGVGANVLPVYLKMTNPKIIDFNEHHAMSLDAAISNAKTAGHDGFVIKNIHDGTSLETAKVSDLYVAFEPEQIKSAIGNGGRFDKNSGSLTDNQFDASPTPQANADHHIASIIDRAEALKAQQPDMPVALREDGTPARLADELDAIRRQARDGTDTEFGVDDAPLLKVAAECFLSMGSAA